MYLLTLSFALGYLSGQLPLPFQALAATVLICLLSTSRIVSPSTPPADEHYDKNLDATPLSLKAIYDSQKAFETKRDDVKAYQSPCRGRAPRQHKQDAGRTVSSENLEMQKYDRSLQATQRPCDNREAPSPRERELPPSRPQSTPSSASTLALTAPHRETRNTELGVTKPDPPPARTFSCDQEPSTHETTEKPGMDQVSTKLHRRNSIVYAGMEHHQGHAADDGQGGSPFYPWRLEKVRPQPIEARLTGASNEDVLAEAHVDVSQAAPSDDTGTKQRSSLSSSSSEEIEVSQQSTDITIDEEHDKHAVATRDGRITETTNDMKSSNDNDGENNNTGELNMSNLLQTSNRLLEDGRQLLADGMRQPRQANTSVVGDEEAGELSHNGPQSHLRSLNYREGWYAHDN